MSQKPTTAAAPALRLVVRGLVQTVTRRTTPKGESYRTLLRTPAVDQYSAPGTFEVRSLRRLGSEGQEIEVECDLLGYSRQFKTQAGDTVRTAEHVLQAA